MRPAPLLVVAALLALPAMPLTTRAQDSAAFTNLQDRAGYAIGVQIGNNLKRSNFEVNLNEVLNGMKDVQAGHELKLTPEQAQQSIMAYQQMRQQEMVEKNTKAGEAFLAANRKKAGVKTRAVTLPDGRTAEFQYKVITEGTGATPGSNDSVTVTYRGTLLDGKEFDSSSRRGPSAKLQVQRVIRGWSEALQMMKLGSKWELYIPAALAYGDRGSGTIEPGSTLVFEVELLDIEAPPVPKPVTSDIIRVPSAAEMQAGAQIEVIKAEDADKMIAGQTNPAAKK